MTKDTLAILISIVSLIISLSTVIFIGKFTIIHWLFYWLGV